jgi:hypothetical protein
MARRRVRASEGNRRIFVKEEGTMKKSENQSVNILGTDYTIKFDRTDFLDKNSGFVNYVTKEIFILEDMDPKLEDNIIRRELAHAYFMEAGLESYCGDEALVKWMSLQLPKIFMTCSDLDCLEGIYGEAEGDEEKTAEQTPAIADNEDEKDGIAGKPRGNSVNILGEKYTIKINPEDFSKRKDGNIDYVTKEISLRTDEQPEFEDIFLRHEIVHGFFMGSGLMDYCDDEILVSWIAIQLPKIVAACQEANAM